MLRTIQSNLNAMLSGNLNLKNRWHSSDIGSKVSSSASLTHLKAQVEQATLLAKAAALKQRQDMSGR